jgi:starch-binding outer membrane protein, SusD/RagB family
MLVFKQMFFMKTIIKSKIIFIQSCILVFIFTSSCKKFVDINTPPGSVGVDEAFADSSSATSVILGLYSNIASGTSIHIGSNALFFYTTVYGAMSADVGYYLNNASFDAFKDNTLSAGNSTINFWNGLYARIGRTNYAIEGLTNSNLSPGLKKQLLGEARFWRAWLYFYLINFFGDVPLVLSTDALSNATLPRKSINAVYLQIVSDLTEAKLLLSDNYPSSERARVNKNVASALLARAFFFQQKWTAAESEASEVINSGEYSIVTDLDEVFLNHSNETIWQISLKGNTTPATVIGAQFIPSGNVPSFVLYDTLINSFEPNDQRKEKWTRSISYLGETYFHPYKYKLRSATAGNEYPVMIRLAEMYLIRAEARAELNNMTGARDDLNVIRSRAGMGNTTASTKEELLLAIENERWIELFTEFSDRWFNLKRKNKANEVLSILKPAWQPFQQLYPIPSQAMSSNPNLVDNPGY